MGWEEIAIKGAEMVESQLTAKQQLERQKKLMGIQMQNQMTLNEQGQNLQMQTWEETNYPAQMAMIKKAGLSAGLIYGKGGTGGTTGSQGGGSASGGNAQQANPMNIANILQMKQIQAQTKLIEAERLKILAETPQVAPTAEAGRSKIESEKGKIEADRILAEVEAEGKRIDNIYKPQMLEKAVENQAETLVRLRRENKIGQETLDTEIEILNNRSVIQALEIELMKSKTKLTDMEIKEIATQLIQKWTELSQKAQGLDQEKQRIALENNKLELAKWEAEMKNKYPSLMNVAGGVIQGALNQLEVIGRYYNPKAFDYSRRKPQ